MTTPPPPRRGPNARLLRRLLLTLVLAVVVSVAWTYRRSSEARPSAPLPAPAAADGDTRTEKLVFKKFQGERLLWTLAAREMVGKEQEEMRLRGVDFSFSYVAQGKPGHGNIVADECTYSPKVQRALFKGNVVVTTEEGFELRTDVLIYRGDKSVAKSDRPVQFKRKDVSGSSTGFTYMAEEGSLELPADVVVNVQDEDNPATEIRAARASLVREEKTLRFTGGVTVKQSADVLTAQRFETDFSDDHVIYRARAIDDVDLRTGGALPGTAGVAGAGGPRHLRCRKLDLWFRSNRLLQEATAGPDADLTLMPGPRDARERHRLGARFLAFAYDELGRLQEVRGQKDSWMRSEPLPPAKGAARSVAAQSFVARLDAATGAAEYVEFTKDVRFEEGTRQATAQKAYYDGATDVVSLKESPELVDSGEGSTLIAQAIDVGSRDGDIAARHDVRHILRKGGGGGLFSGSGQPVLLTARFLDYDGQTKVGVYRQDALLRAGKDEVRGGEIRLTEKDGVRRLEASGGVVSLLHPRREGAEAPPAPVDGRAREMVYDEARRELVYKGEVVIKQGVVSIRGPRATIELTADGADVRTMRAGEPVQVEQGERRAQGLRATYDPRAGTMALVGEPVTLVDPRQHVQGRAVTFNLGDDRVVVDGQERARTQTVIRSRREPPRP
ncbi:MAG TPA: LPS export ABC transporter periplasmic protein LptC [Vicinamibacteria bacterium]|nr:LPS export ABC transporter periplasmic protein LptC [Vicinamibacteria bacterium]